MSPASSIKTQSAGTDGKSGRGRVWRERLWRERLWRERLWRGIWLAFYMLVTVGVPVADAFVEHGSPIVAHWEDGTDSTCPTRHDPSACQLCQTIATHGRVTASAPALPLSVGDVVALVSALDAGTGSSPVPVGLGPRAPPVA